MEEISYILFIPIHSALFPNWGIWLWGSVAFKIYITWTEAAYSVSWFLSKTSLDLYQDGIVVRLSDQELREEHAVKLQPSMGHSGQEMDTGGLLLPLST